MSNETEERVAQFPDDKQPGRLPTILYADDDARCRLHMEDCLQQHGFRVILASDGREALNLMMSEQIDLLISDERMPLLSGTELFKHVRQKSPHCPFILLTGFGDVHAATSLMKLDGVDYFEKPYQISDLIKSIERLLGSEIIENVQVPLSNDKVKYFSSPMIKFQRDLNRAATSKGNIWICGEWGSGKEYHARSILDSEGSTEENFRVLSSNLMTQDRDLMVFLASFRADAVPELLILDIASLSRMHQK